MCSMAVSDEVQSLDLGFVAHAYSRGSQVFSARCAQDKYYCVAINSWGLSGAIVVVAVVAAQVCQDRRSCTEQGHSRCTDGWFYFEVGAGVCVCSFMFVHEYVLSQEDTYPFRFCSSSTTPRHPTSYPHP